MGQFPGAKNPQVSCGGLRPQGRLWGLPTDSERAAGDRRRSARLCLAIGFHHDVPQVHGDHTPQRYLAGLSGCGGLTAALDQATVFLLIGLEVADPFVAIGKEDGAFAVALVVQEFAFVACSIRVVLDACASAHVLLPGAFIAMSGIPVIGTDAVSCALGKIALIATV